MQCKIEKVNLKLRKIDRYLLNINSSYEYVFKVLAGNLTITKPILSLTTKITETILFRLLSIFLLFLL